SSTLTSGETKAGQRRPASPPAASADHLTSRSGPPAARPHLCSPLSLSLSLSLLSFPLLPSRSKQLPPPAPEPPARMANPHQRGALYGAGPLRSREGLSARSAAGNSGGGEIQLQIDPMHADLDEHISGLHRSGGAGAGGAWAVGAAQVQAWDDASRRRCRRCRRLALAWADAALAKAGGRRGALCWRRVDTGRAWGDAGSAGEGVVAQEIESEAKFQNNLLSQLQMTVLKAQAGLKNNVRRLNKRIIQQGSNHVVHVVLFALFCFFLVYLWSKYSRR
ncbi:hypothetical protein Taro_013474, partial [Colocasia esculenta]|nr:hypothetical protein [Colocasia esculenta]